MSEQQAEQLELEIKRLERDRKVEEIRQLRASGIVKWITPAAMTALLPLVAGFLLWTWGELKQYSEGHRALREIESIRKEKATLQEQKNSLHLEVTALLALKAHYADQSKVVLEKFEATQRQIDIAYARARFATAEATYALSHIRGMPSPNRQALDGLANAVDTLPGEASGQVRTLVRRCQLAVDMAEASASFLTAANQAFGLIPATDRMVKLQPMPTGAVISDRKIMIRQGDQGPTYYDVDAARFLSQEEAAGAR